MKTAFSRLVSKLFWSLSDYSIVGTPIPGCESLREVKESDSCALIGQGGNQIPDLAHTMFYESTPNRRYLVVTDPTSGDTYEFILKYYSISKYIHLRKDLDPREGLDDMIEEGEIPLEDYYPDSELWIGQTVRLFMQALELELRCIALYAEQNAGRI